MKFLFSCFLFIFLIGFVSAIASISGVPNINLQLLDYEEFNVNTYATGNDNISNIITFNNPVNGQSVVLYGDIGGQHSNIYFTISLGTTGLVQIQSNNLQLVSIPILVSVGNNRQTQDADSFILSIQSGGGSNNFNPNIINLTMTDASDISSPRVIDLRNYFTSGPYRINVIDSGLNTTWITGSTCISLSDCPKYYFNTVGRGTLGFVESKIDDYGDRIYFTRTGVGGEEFNIFVSAENSSIRFNIKNTSFSNAVTIKIKETPFDYTNIMPYKGSLILDEYFAGYNEFHPEINYSTHRTCRNLNLINQPYVGGNISIRVDSYAGSNNRYNNFSWINPTGIDIQSNEFLSVGVERDVCLPLFISDGLTSQLYITGIISGLLDSIGNNINNNGTMNSFNSLRNWVTNIYPESENLSLKVKWSYVLITLLVPFFTLFVILIMSQGKIPIKLAIWASFVVDILLFFFLIAIGYVPVTILVIFGLAMAMWLYQSRR